MAVAVVGTKNVKTTMPDAATSGATVNGSGFSVPEGYTSMAIHCPALTGSATLLIQSLDPIDNSTWRAVSVFDLTGVTSAQPLDSIADNAVTTLPLTATGGGYLRFVASQDQSAAAVRITVAFARHR